jgi:glutamate-1-semialdehyde 2,1-aminomutase
MNTRADLASSTEVSRCAQLFERAQKVLPGGVSATLCFAPRTHPTPPRRGLPRHRLDGVTRIDFSNNMASLIHGHAHPEIVRAVNEQMARGTAFMMATEPRCDTRSICARATRHSTCSGS